MRYLAIMVSHNPQSPLYTHGAPGSKIPGSKYVREYCLTCGEPIRVPPASFDGKGSNCLGCQANRGVIDFAADTGGGKRILFTTRGLS